ncbi:MAG: D-cysteine desulfhydrase family protein [Halioglobus sp.]|nr:D-cysteine desulfhydrase family protein [Halioglobus sp.]
MISTYLEKFPTFALGHLPTPLQPLERLGAELGGPTLWIKRDDCTGLALGGNKVRKLEYLLGEARAEGVDTLVTVGAVQSNHVRQTAAAAAVAGMQCEAVLVEAVDRHGWNATDSGNVILDTLLGANVHRLASEAEAPAYILQLLEDLAAQGRTPTFIPLGGSGAVGNLGYLAMVEELLAQLPTFDAIYLASSTGGTQAGMLAGLHIQGHDARVHGVTVYNPDAAALRAEIEALCNATLEHVGAGSAIPAASIQVEGGYVGTGYGQTTPQCLDAVRLVARLEAIVLDPVYTGKAMAALIDHVRQGRFDGSENIVFLHTGGAPALFAYAEEFAQTV